MDDEKQTPAVGMIIFCHGAMAEGMLSAAETIIGPQPGVRTLSVSPGMGKEQAEENLRSAIAETDEGSGVLVLTDLIGGTPCNTTAMQLGERVELVAGFNLPALIKGLLSRRSALSPRQLAQEITGYAVEHTTTGSTMLGEGSGRRG